MSHIPNPFGDKYSPNNGFTTPPNAPRYNQPFLLMSRPPSSSPYRARSSDQGYGRRHSRGTPPFNYNPNYRPQQERFSSPRYPHGNNYRNYSPRSNFSSPYSPRFNQDNSYSSRGFNKSGYNNSRNFNASFSSRGPLKDVPIEHFINPDMVKDPWQSLEMQNIRTNVSIETEETSNASELDNTTLSSNSSLTDDRFHASPKPSDEEDSSISVKEMKVSLGIETSSSTSEKDASSDSGL